MRKSMIIRSLYNFNWSTSLTAKISQPDPGLAHAKPLLIVNPQRIDLPTTPKGAKGAIMQIS